VFETEKKLESGGSDTNTVSFRAAGIALPKPRLSFGRGPAACGHSPLVKSGAVLFPKRAIVNSGYLYERFFPFVHSRAILFRFGAKPHGSIGIALGAFIEQACKLGWSLSASPSL